MDFKKLCIEELKLQPHPEGGYFRETFRSKEIIKKENLPERYSGDRSMFTSILFMIDDKNFSAFHRLKTDELWYYNFGNSLLLTTIDEYGNLSEIILGSSFHIGEKLQHLVPAGSWMSASVLNEEGFSLIGCSMSPGFDYDDFELANREKLIELFPMHRVIIEKYTR
jgi:hypothetical protein